jgi:alkanesulfonate monooxygenase
VTIEFIGYVAPTLQSEIIQAATALDPDHVDRAAKIHENAGFDRVLVAFGSTAPESILVAARAAAVTTRLGFLIAHRPGFTAPTVAARQFATLDVLTGGRIALHVITGGTDAEMRRDGSHITKDERYQRTDEYLDIVRREWTSTQPFDHQGHYFHVEQAFSAVKSPQAPHIPIYFGGASDAAIRVAGKHADVYALWGETYAQVAELVGRVRAEAARHGRNIRFSLSLRPILAETEANAWARAEDILHRAGTLAEKRDSFRKGQPENTGSRRLLAAAAQGGRLDKCLWTGIAGLLGAQGNSTALVGTAEQVADALADYHALGITTFLIRGFDPLEDAVAYGRDLLPATKHLIGQRTPGTAEQVLETAAGD